MNVILGFGSTEEREQAAILAAITEAGGDVDAAIAPWNSRADEYDTMPRGTAPARYTRIYNLGDTLCFHHVNRNHAMSPDGWALLRVEVPIKNGGAA